MPDERYAIGAMEVRSIDADKRTATFVAATETPVATWRGIQYLDITGVSLDRYNRNNVLLDSHDRTSIESVVGNATMRIEGRLLIADTTFANTPRGNNAWALVHGGNVRAVSVGFMADQILSVNDGATHTLGDVEIRGPAEVVTKWTLLELSLVPVPADPNAIVRAQLQQMDQEAAVRLLEEIQHGGIPTTDNRGGHIMSDKKEEAVAARDVITPIEQCEADEALRIRLIKNAIVPGVEDIAARCISTGLPVEQFRVLCHDYWESRSKPVGTPEPPIVTKDQPTEDDKLDVRTLSGAELVDLINR